jgi:hypothetical protein
MSGFEIAGIVIGSIPIILSALRIQRNIVKPGVLYRWRFYTRELDNFIGKLDVEHLRLVGVFEKLLTGIVPDELISVMINDPLGPLWKDPGAAERIRIRLGPSIDPFESGVQDIQKAMAEIGTMLGLGPDGEVSVISH